MATLLQLEPALGRLIGMRAAARVGRRQVLPVLSVPAGPWRPGPPPPGALSMAVVDGFLLGSGELLGPTDQFAPWTAGSHWTACSEVQFAVLGHELMDALRAWPTATARLLERRAPARVLPPRADPLERRLPDVLWRIAQRWGQVGGPGIVLPAALDLAVLAAILEAPSGDVASGVAQLDGSGVLRRLPNAPWGLVVGDDLRSHVAYQCALARATTGAYTALVMDSVSGE